MIIFAIKTESGDAGQQMARIIHTGTATFERLPLGSGFFDLYMLDSVAASSARRIDEDFEDDHRDRDRRRDYRRDHRGFNEHRDDREDRESREFFRRGCGPKSLSDYQTLAAHVANMTEAETVLIISDQFNVATGAAEHVSGLFEASMDFYVDQFRNRGVVRTESVNLPKPDPAKEAARGTLNVANK